MLLKNCQKVLKRVFVPINQSINQSINQVKFLVGIENMQLHKKSLSANPKKFRMKIHFYHMLTSENA